jgi:hypothetical protein
MFVEDNNGHPDHLTSNNVIMRMKDNAVIAFVWRRYVKQDYDVSNADGHRSDQWELAVTGSVSNYTRKGMQSVDSRPSK